MSIETKNTVAEKDDETEYGGAVEREERGPYFHKRGLPDCIKLH